MVKSALRYILVLSVLGLFVYSKGIALHEAHSLKPFGFHPPHLDRYSAFFLDSYKNERSFFKRTYKPRGVAADVPHILDPFTFRFYITQPFLISIPQSICFSVSDLSNPKRGPPLA